MGVWTKDSGVVLTSSVKGNDLVTENVVACLQVRWNLNQPGVAVVDEGIGSPAVGIAGAIDLEELERSLVDRLAVTITGG